MAKSISKACFQASSKIKIAFDLDGVIVDKPPLIPKKLLEWLFRGNTGDRLDYRFPRSKVEQGVRKLSHFYLFRPAIKENITFIDKISKDKRFEIFAISGRYAFLKPETEKWLAKRKAGHLFKAIFLNLSDEQPHLFKEKKLKELGADIFIDDDGLLADYLAQKCPKTKIFLFTKDAKSIVGKAQSVRLLEEILR
jgi:hypothetical protein